MDRVPQIGLQRSCHPKGVQRGQALASMYLDDRYQGPEAKSQPISFATAIYAAIARNHVWWLTGSANTTTNSVDANITLPK